MIISCDYDMTMTMIGWFVYVVCLSDAKSCENNDYLAILGKHDVFAVHPGKHEVYIFILQKVRLSLY